MWEALREQFEDISPMGVTDTLLQISRKKMSDFTSASQYCSAYEKAMNKAIGMLRDESEWSSKGIEALVQGYMMANAGETYAPLISQLRRDWKIGTGNFREVTKAIVTYVTSEKPKALHTKQKFRRSNQSPIQTCTTPECIAKGRGFHLPEQCWIKHPELRPKFQLKDMKPTGTTRLNAESNPEEVKPQLHIDS